MTSSLVREVRASVGGLGYADCVRALQTLLEVPGDRAPLRVALLRSYTVDPVQPVLHLHLLLDGFDPEFWIGGYNQYQVEVLDQGSALHAFEPDLVLMMVRIEEVLPEFVEAYANRTADEWREIVMAAADELVGLARKAASDLSAQVVLQNASLADAPYFGIFDAQIQDGQEQLVRAFNRRLAGATATPGIFIWDFADFTSATGRAQLYDAKMWYVSRNPYRQAAYPVMALDLMRYVRSALGRIKKCVVLDLDNTLWGGVAGEDGLEGVALGDSYPGNCYKDFQRQLLRLYHRGVLLAIASKNNEDDAYRIIDDHPDMMLRRVHFAAARINWNDKASNLRDLAAELNIGLDSLVFVDDNPAECELVRQELPEVEVVQVPSKPHLVPQVVKLLPQVENIRVTGEDRKKGEMYRAQAARRTHESQFSDTDLEGFLASLNMEIAIDTATSFSIPRIAQLTQKTNQMNMTTRRYTEAEIQSLAADDSWSVLSVSARDRFGDHGIIGVLLLDHSEHETRVDTFLLSCRVIGRGIEQNMVERALEIALARGSRHLVGEFIPTRKNAPAAGFYESAGFERLDEHRLVRATA